MKNMFIRMIVIMTIHIFCYQVECYSADMPVPIYPIEATEDTQLVVEFQHKYFIFEYRQPLKIFIIDRAVSKYVTPEDSFISLVSSIAGDNLDWYNNSWDVESQLQKASALQTELNELKSKLTLGDIILTKRVERKSIVVLHYQIKKSETLLYDGYFYFKASNGDWKATVVLPDDPVFKYYADLDKTDNIQIMHN